MRGEDKYNDLAIAGFNVVLKIRPMTPVARQTKKDD
jgi:hypothetical protein